MTDYKAEQIGNTWGVGMNGTMLVVGLSESHAKSMVADLRQAEYEQEVLNGVAVQDDDNYFDGCLDQ